MALADTANGVEPSYERLTLARRGAARLRGPCALVDEFDRGPAKLLAKFLAFNLKSLERNAGAAIELIIELAPSPGSRGIARRLTLAVYASAIANRAGPRGCGGFQLGNQCAPEIEISLTALEFVREDARKRPGRRRSLPLSPLRGA